VRGAARQRGARTRDLARFGLEAVIGLGDGVRVERVRFDDIGTGGEISLVDGADRVGLGEVQKIVVAAEIARRVAEARAAERRLVEVPLLDLGAHGAVEQENPLGGELRQEMRAGLVVPAVRHAASCIGFRPRRRQMAAVSCGRLSV